MRSKTILALALLNVALLVSLCFGDLLNRRAIAQAAPVTRPSDYLMIPGEVQGGSAGVVFIVDTRNNLLSARTYDSTSSKMQDMPPIDLARIFKAR